MLLKYCPKCQATKAVSLFNRSAQQSDGFQSYCRFCSIRYSREHRRKTTLEAILQPGLDQLAGVTR